MTWRMLCELKVRCYALQCVAVRGSVLQCVAVCCSVLYCTSLTYASRTYRVTPSAIGIYMYVQHTYIDTWSVSAYNAIHIYTHARYIQTYTKRASPFRILGAPMIGEARLEYKRRARMGPIRVRERLSY